MLKLTSGSGKPCSISSRRVQLSGGDSARGEAELPQVRSTHRAAWVRSGPDPSSHGASELVALRFAIRRVSSPTASASAGAGGAEQVRDHLGKRQDAQAVEYLYLIVEEAAVMDDEPGSFARATAVGNEDVGLGRRDRGAPVQQGGGGAADDGVGVRRQQCCGSPGAYVEHAVALDHDAGPERTENTGAKRVVEAPAAALPQEIGAPVGTVETGRGEGHGSTIGPRRPRSR